MPTTYLPRRKVAERYGRSSRTIFDWERDPDLGFPKPILIRGRSHFPIDGEDGLDAWDRKRRGDGKPAA